MSMKLTIAFNVLAAELIAIGIGHQLLWLILAVLAIAWLHSGFLSRRLLATGGRAGP